MLTPLYSASTRIQIDRTTAKIVQGGDITARNDDDDFLRTEYERLNSRMLAERVASTLRLGDDADFFKPRDYSLFNALRSLIHPAPVGELVDKSMLERSAAGMVQANVAIRPITGSRMVDINYTDSNPGRAQRIADAYANAYVASNLDKRFEANAYAKTFLEDQIKQLKLRLEELQRSNSWSSPRRNRSSPSPKRRLLPNLTLQPQTRRWATSFRNG